MVGDTSDVNRYEQACHSVQRRLEMQHHPPMKKQVLASQVTGGIPIVIFYNFTTSFLQIEQSNPYVPRYCQQEARKSPLQTEELHRG